MSTRAALPPRSTLRQDDTHRLIPSRFRDPHSVLARIADDAKHLQAIFDLDHATNDRLLGEHDRLPGIGVHELLFGVPHYRVVNAAFTHAHPMGSRFNGPERGAWYCAFELRTAQAEVIFHKTVQLAEIGRFEDEAVYDDYLADVRGDFHDLRNAPGFEDCLAADSYVQSQELAGRLLAAESLGIVYPSVRRAGGTCLACFRPALVTHVRRGASYTLRWQGSPKPVVRRTSDRA